MGKLATNIDEQIKTLESRGLILDLERSKVKEILLDIGYYRLGFYWNPFQLNDKHDFKEGSRFSDVVSLYYLDVDLRHLLVKYINRIEINFKTCLIYYASNKYPKEPTWFANPRIVSSDFILELQKNYTEEFKVKNIGLKKHHTKYSNDKYAPAWKALEYFYFGTNLSLYRSLKDDELKLSIAGVYEIKVIDTFYAHMTTIKFIRNICAHGGVLFDVHTPKGITKIPGLVFNGNDRNSLDTIIKLILFYVGKISKNRKDDLKLELQNLMNAYRDNEVLKKIIEEKTGYIYV